MHARFVCVLLALLPCAVTSAQGGILKWLFGRNEIEVITVTDMTPEGRQQRAATPENPVYYVAVSLGFRDLGGIMAGDKPPPKEDVLHQIAVALAKQGYLPATDTSPPPTLVLTFVWGTLYADYFYGPNPDLPPRQLNRHQILKFLGGYKMGFSESDFDPLVPTSIGLTLMNSDSSSFYDLAREDFYVAVVAAYDLAAINNKDKRLLWMTRISCPALRYNMTEVLPTMLTVGGANFGRESAQPVWYRASDKYRPEVKFGELKLIEYLGSDPLPMVETPTDQAKKKAKKR